MTVGRGRGSGKVILFGEHAVVYGVPGVAAGIERGASSEAHLADVESAGGTSRLSLGETAVHANAAGSDLARSFAALLAEGTPFPPLEVVASAEVPPGGGLGCSAALGVAIARAAARATGREADDEEVFARAMAWERVYHGNPSGIDARAAIAGAFLWFERGKPTRPIEVASDLWLAVGFSGRGASTKLMVESIAALVTSDPDLHARFLSGVRSIVERAEPALARRDAATLSALFVENQALLSAVHLSTPAIDRMIELARATGISGVKLTGSGGGGSVIALGGFADRDELGSASEQAASALAERWSAEGFPAFPTRIRGSAPAPAASA
jgi:mevalonate kinase